MSLTKFKVKLEKGWKFDKYENDSDIHGRSQTIVRKGDTRITMIQSSGVYRISINRNTSQHYDSFGFDVDPLGPEPELRIESLMRMLK